MSARIIVIDDDERIRLLYQTELSAAGFAVKTAASGSQAIGMVAAERFDLALLDIEMPDMGGLEVLGIIREIAPNMRVILNSAYAVHKADFKSWLADAYLVKSSDTKLLKQKIKELVAPREHS